MDKDAIIQKIETLQKYLNEYSDEIPNYLVKSVDKYKCTNGAFTFLFGQIDLLKYRKLLPEKVIDEYDNFREQYQERRRRKEFFLVRKEDVEKGNDLTKKAINSLLKLLEN